MASELHSRPALVTAQRQPKTLLEWLRKLSKFREVGRSRQLVMQDCGGNCAPLHQILGENHEKFPSTLEEVFNSRGMPKIVVIRKSQPSLIFCFPASDVVEISITPTSNFSTVRKALSVSTRFVKSVLHAKVIVGNDLGAIWP